MRHSVGGRDSLDGLERGLEEDMAASVAATMRDAAAELKADWSEQIVAAGLGDRLARTIKAEVYPKGQNSMDAAAMVRTKAPKIIDAYARGATIRPVNGAKFLWIPTDDVPKKRQGNRLTPNEVEARYGRQLDVFGPGVSAVHRSPSIFRNGQAFAGYRFLTPRKGTGRWRNATVNELNPKKRSYKPAAGQFVIMFILVPQVRVPKRLDLEALQAAAEAAYPGLLSKNWR